MFETYEDMVTIDDVCQMLNIGKNNAYFNDWSGKIDLVRATAIKKIR